MVMEEAVKLGGYIRAVSAVDCRRSFTFARPRGLRPESGDRVNSAFECGHAPAEFQRLCRLHVAAAAVCRAMVRASSRGELVESVVQTLVGTGVFTTAVISRLNPETQELVREVSCGDATGYME